MKDSRAQTDAKVKDNNLNLKMNLKLIRVSLICDMKDNFLTYYSECKVSMGNRTHFLYFTFHVWYFMPWPVSDFFWQKFPLQWQTKL